MTSRRQSRVLGQGSALAKTVSQRPELVVDDVESQLGIYAEVLVHDDVAQTCYRSPWDLWCAVARLTR